MSITDELREFIDSLACHKDTRDMMRRIADRIDKEHAEAVADALQLRGEPDRWVELPVDADGIPIHVGDMVGWDGDEEFEVKGFGGSRAERLFYLNESGRFCWGIAENCHHHQPDSWERIVEDAMMLGCVTYPAASDKHALVERCRRLAGEGE